MPRKWQGHAQEQFGVFRHVASQKFSKHEPPKGHPLFLKTSTCLSTGVEAEMKTVAAVTATQVIIDFVVSLLALGMLFAADILS